VGGRDKVIGDRFRRETANSPAVPETAGGDCFSWRAKERRSGREWTHSCRDGTRSHWLPRWRSVTPVGRLNNMVRLARQRRELPLPRLPTSFGVPRLTHGRLLAAACLYPIPNSYPIVMLPPRSRYAGIPRCRAAEISRSSRQRGRQRGASLTRAEFEERIARGTLLTLIPPAFAGKRERERVISLIGTLISQDT